MSPELIRLAKTKVALKLTVGNITRFAVPHRDSKHKIQELNERER